MFPAVVKVIEQIRAEEGKKFSLDKVNLVELKQGTGIFRALLRQMKEHDRENTEHISNSKRAAVMLLSGYTGLQDSLLKKSVKNSPLYALADSVQINMPVARPRLKTTLQPSNNSFRLQAMRLFRKEIVDGDITPDLEKYTRWTGDLLRSNLSA